MPQDTFHSHRAAGADPDPDEDEVLFSLWGEPLAAEFSEELPHIVEQLTALLAAGRKAAVEEGGSDA